MLETERSSDEALREPTYRRLYLGALEIDNSERQLKACYIILLAGRMGLRTGEIQHVREEWIDWDRGEIAIPQHDPCACANCWIRAKQKASGEDEDIREEIVELFEDRVSDGSDRDIEEVVDNLPDDDEALPDEIAEEIVGPEDDESERTAEAILYEERWRPKYARSARRVPFGHSRRLTAVIVEFMKKHDHLEITQVAMMNLVEEAAEHADGVDPENITIRGLRATASTHYATYIRNPKALQDLMGWTRIETAARYLRRAGAFTTDVVYHAFDQGDLAPAMFPDEPKERYPILNNPLQYDKEPYDPMGYDKKTRHKIGQNIADESFRQLIHPRAKNPPDQLEYDRSRHQILTHEDYEDDVIERDGMAMFESPTITEFYEDDDRITPADVESDDSKRRYESEQEWERHNTRQSNLIEIIDDEEDDYRTHIRGLLAPILVKYLEFVEWAGEVTSKYLPTPEPPKTTVGRVAVAGVGYAVVALLMMISLVQVGILNLQTMTLEFRPSALLPLGIALYIAYKLPKTESLTEIFS
jgi:integrase